MKIYENRNDKRNVSCSYCFETGHNIRQCKALRTHYEQHQRGEKCDISLLTTLQGWYAFNLKHLDNWFVKKGLVYAERIFAPKAKCTTPRKASKCGFCGSLEHNRKNCNIMSEFKYLFEQANKAYRQEFYDRFIKDMGLGAGALVSIRQYDREQNEYVSKVALMTELDPKSISLTNLQNRWSDYRTDLRIGFLLDGQMITMGGNSNSKLFHFDVSRNEGDYLGNAHGVPNPSTWEYGLITSIVSPAPNIMSQEWFDGEFEPIDWVMKKRTVQSLWLKCRYFVEHYYSHDDKVERLSNFKKSIGSTV